MKQTLKEYNYDSRYDTTDDWHQHRLDAACSHARLFHAAGICPCRSGLHAYEEHRQHSDEDFVDFLVGSILFWLFGFGIMFGAGSLMGMPTFGDIASMAKVIDNGLPIEGFLVFQTVFCATSATIVSGAMAERTKFSMYLVYTICISVLIYPVSGHWTWGGGWLMNGAEDSFMMQTFGSASHDFAGSMVVHSVGGWISLVGAWILVPASASMTRTVRAAPFPDTT
jgi:ammonia channel protein AmtB